MAKIFLVDDSALARKLIIKILEKTEHQVVGEAETGEKAILNFRKLNPDVIMMDLDMPGMGGLEAAAKIRVNHPEVKVVIVSAHEKNYFSDELEKIGTSYFITKPINSAKVTAALQSAIGQDEKPVKEKSESKKAESEKEKAPEVQREAEEGQETGAFGDIKLQAGDKVIISHFSSTQDLKATILEKENSTLVLKLDKDYPIHNFTVNEPVTLGVEFQNELYVCEASVMNLNTKDKKISLEVEKIHNLNEDQLIEFFPTSLNVNVKEEFQSKSAPAVVKNIGVYILAVVSRAELNEGTKVVLDMYLDNKVLSLTAEITEKVRKENVFEYNVKVTFVDLGNKRAIALFIQRLKSQLVESIFSLKQE